MVDIINYGYDIKYYGYHMQKLKSTKRSGFPSLLSANNFVRSFHFIEFHCYNEDHEPTIAALLVVQFLYLYVLLLWLRLGYEKSVNNMQIEIVLKFLSVCL